MTEYDHPEEGCLYCEAGEGMEHNPEPLDDGVALGTFGTIYGLCETCDRGAHCYRHD
jgi:hypothetical protein